LKISKKKYIYIIKKSLILRKKIKFAAQEFPSKLRGEAFPKIIKKNMKEKIKNFNYSFPKLWIARIITIICMVASFLFIIRVYAYIFCFAILVVGKGIINNSLNISRIYEILQSANYKVS